MSSDPRLNDLLTALRALKAGELLPPIPAGTPDAIGQIGEELAELAVITKRRLEQIQTLVRVTEKINAGVLLDDVLNHVYDSFRALVPYDRIGFSLLEDGGRTIRAIWARSTAPALRLGADYTAPMATSSLAQVLASGRCRILNDLEGYLLEHPASESTALIVAEGMRSSLTCPLVAAGEPIGFMFFSSVQRGAYLPEHVALLQQITGQLALVVEKSRLYQKLVALNVEKNTLLGMAAHDLRGPITVVQGFVELVQDGIAGPTTTKQQEIFVLVRRACRTMLGLIDNFLDVSAIEAGRLRLQPREVDLIAFLQQFHLTSRLLAEAKAIHLEAEIPADLPRANLDPERIGQVLSNLISNAIKFSFPHSTITLGARVVENVIELSVRDQGQGIPAAELPKLFSTFGRTSVRPTAGEKSTGLGLAIVKRMVEAHGGALRVESEVGVGSTFICSLPLPQASGTAGADSPVGEPGPTASERSPTEPDHAQEGPP